MMKIVNQSGSSENVNTSRKDEEGVMESDTKNKQKNDQNRMDEKNHQHSSKEKTHEQREKFDKDHDLSQLSEEERKRMHEQYSEMGKKGGPIGGRTRAESLGHEGYQDLGHMGGVTRAEQMAKSDDKTKKQQKAK